MNSNTKASTIWIMFDVPPPGRPDESRIDLTGMMKRGEFMGYPREKELKFGDFVVTGMQQGNDNPELYIGRLVQMRIGEGAYGSTMFFIRHPNGVLMRHENQSLWRLRWTDRAKVRAMFTEELLAADGENHSYTYPDGEARIGFMIEKEVKS